MRGMPGAAYSVRTLAAVKAGSKRLKSGLAKVRRVGSWSAPACLILECLIGLSDSPPHQINGDVNIYGRKRVLLKDWPVPLET